MSRKCHDDDSNHCQRAPLALSLLSMRTGQAPKGFPTVVFCDGASTGNPGPGGWGAIIATPDGYVVELGDGYDGTTNNKMELQAVISALSFLKNGSGPVAVYTDSSYVILGITKWIWGWQKKGWKNSEGLPVANQDLWKKLVAVVARLRSAGVKIDWCYVRGHSGVPGNERVDEIASMFARGRYTRLYRGPLLKYDVAIHDIPGNTDVPEMRKREKTAEKSVAYSYLSLVNGIPRRHETWGECKNRIDGQAHAKCKKTKNAGDETAVLASWGFKPGDVK